MVRISGCILFCNLLSLELFTKITLLCPVSPRLELSSAGSLQFLSIRFTLVIEEKMFVRCLKLPRLIQNWLVQHGDGPGPSTGQRGPFLSLLQPFSRTPNRGCRIFRTTSTIEIKEIPLWNFFPGPRILQFIRMKFDVKAENRANSVDSKTKNWTHSI